MTNRKLILGSLVAVLIGGMSLPSAARTDVDFYVNVAPPPLRYEIVPAPRIGWIWVPGYWDWRYKRHHWVPGHYVRHRPGFYYAPAHWAHRGDRYYYNRPEWRHDRDRDGVPDRFDRAPRNPYYR
jgi:hypothetical protein